jgi:hypothetical protein
VFTDVVVPPYADTPFSITPIVLAVSPGRVSAPRDLLTGVLPVVPTADRELATAQNLTAFMRLYQTGQKPIGRVVLNISVRDTREQVVARESRMLETKEFVAIGQALIGPTAVPTPPPRSGPRPTIPTAVSQDQFANLGLRTADVRYTVPIAGLMPGEYLLTFEATLGDAVLRRDLRFAVR